MNKAKYVLVTGATGSQGGAVVQRLLERGHRVRAMTRNASSEAAKRLAAQGVEIVVADFSNPASLRQAADGVDAVYAMTTPFESSPEAETQQGIAMIEAAKAAGVEHFIYSSVGGANRNTGVPHFESKHRVEEQVEASGLNYSISAPVYFMDNLLAPWNMPGLKEGTLGMAMPADRPLQQISVRDIGRFAVALIERGEEVYGRRFDIAGHELDGNASTAILTEAANTAIQFQGFPADALRAQSEDMALMFEWFDKVGYAADIPALRNDFPEVGWEDYAEWAGRQDWTVLAN